MSKITAYVIWASITLAACAAPSPVASNSVTGDSYAAPAPWQVTAEPWPEASERFHVQPVWLGADSAYSIDLDDDHVLWLFADTFLDPTADGSRENGPNFFIRNSVAIQSGSHDLSESQLAFYWGPSQAGTPSSFFHDLDGSEVWVWPFHGARLRDGRLLLFRMHVLKESGGLGFRVDGWDALAVDDPLAPPDTWQPRVLTPKQHTFDKLVGSSVLIHDGHVYAYTVDNRDAGHAIYLARWPEAELLGLSAGALDDPEWWTSTGFVRQSALSDDGAQLEPLFPDGQVELSVHYDARRKRFVEIQMQGLFVADPATQIGQRSAPRPEGPWSALSPFFRPAEHTLPNAGDLAAYAAKAHPEQRGADWVISYVVNDLKRFPPGDNVYYPKLLRAQLK